MKKFILIFMVLIGFIFASDNLNKTYWAGMKAYNSQQYDAAEKTFLKLEKENFEQSYYLFCLGKIYRHNKDHDNAVKYLEKFLKVHTSEKSKLAASICLAYEYKKGKHWNEDTVAKAYNLLSKYSVGDANKHGFVNEYNSCMANLINNVGYVKIKGTNNPSLFKKAIDNFKTSLGMKEDPMVANNLLYTYLNLAVTDKPNKSKYLAEAAKILSDYKDSDYKSIAANRKYYKYLNTT